MSNSLKWCLKIKLEALKIPPVSLAMRIEIGDKGTSWGAEPTGQSTQEEAETSWIAFFKKLGCEGKRRDVVTERDVKRPEPVYSREEAGRAGRQERKRLPYLAVFASPPPT